MMQKNGQEIDLGFVGDPKTVDPHVLKTLAQGGMIPVIAPVSAGEGGETYNINADTAAGAIAAAVGATRLLLLTDVPGVLDKDRQAAGEPDGHAGQGARWATARFPAA